MQRAWADGRYYELECYFKIEKNLQTDSNHSSYRADLYKHSENQNGAYTLRLDRSTKKIIENDIAGKWRRFYGDEQRLTIERVLEYANAFLLLTALASFLLAIIAFALLLVVVLVMSTRAAFNKLRG